MRTNLNEVPKSPMPPRPTVHRERKSGTAQDYEARLRAEQRLGKGILGGFAAALAGAVLWAVISAVTHFQIVYKAVGVALGVAWSLRHFGKGVDLIFGVAGAVLSLLGVVAGNLLVLAALLAQKYSMSIPELLVQMLDNPDTSAELLNDSFFPFGALSYAIALYFGFTLSYRHERYERPDDWTGGIGH